MRYSLETLEYKKLVSLIAGYAQTPMGVKSVTGLAPLESRIEVDAALEAIREVIRLNEEKQVTYSFSGLEDPSAALSVLRIRGATLEPNTLLEIARVCTSALFARSVIQQERDAAPNIWQIVEQIPQSLIAVAGEITRRLLPGGEIDDSASPELARLRREINAQRARLTRSLESAMRSAGSAIQDEIVTMRNDRYVIPVKADFRGKVGGVAHGFSSSGATVFVEPLDAIEANNELQNLKGQEEREIARILASLTEGLRKELSGVEAAVEAVTELDFVKAKVKFARSFRAVVPEISDDGSLDLTDARHPLLEENFRKQATEQKNADGEAASIIPSSFGLGRRQPVMIISGANAGGKTVVLKTAGLLSLMAISGLPVPAKAARIPFYRSVLADIGDNQSLSANLSTFSSHMSNIASMMSECTAPSLVMLDEAGTGTDPEEGSALGVAIVDHFRRNCGAHVIASTHYRGLKIYAANDEGVLNASVEFDLKTLKPTYRLLLGIAGASSGIEIARRFGIDAQVIDVARENLDVSAQEAEQYLLRLQNETKIATDLRIALEEEREAVALKYAGLEVDAVKKEKARQREFQNELAQSLEEFDRQSKAFIKTIEDKALQNRLEKERLGRKAELNRSLSNKVSETNAGTRGGGSIFANGPRTGGTGASSPGGSPRVGSPHVSKGSTHGLDASSETTNVIAIGSKVITSFGNIGTVERMDKDIAEVLVGGMRLREKISDLAVAEPPASAGAKTAASRSASTRSSGVSSPRDTEDREAPAELNLIGKTTADAEYELDRFLDEAYMARTPRVRIIHGFGTGALKNYVHHFLKNSDLVERFEFAPSNQGGNGATVAEMKV